MMMHGVVMVWKSSEKGKSDCVIMGGVMVWR